MLLLTAGSSCDSVIYDDFEECPVEYLLYFKYDYNMKWADAFPNEVKSVRLYAFDADSGELVWTTTESGQHLAEKGFCIPLQLKPGKYHLQAWCGADNNPGDEHFAIAQDFTSVSAKEHSTCYLLRNYEGTQAVSDKSLHPLFHGILDIEIPLIEDRPVSLKYEMPLVKDTNKIRIVLQQLSGKDLNVDDFQFKIEDANGSMAHDNSLVDDELIQYRPWITYSGTAGIETKDPVENSRTITQVSVAQAEIDVARMMENHRKDMKLTISRSSDGEVVAKIPVIDYALLVKGFEREGLGDQEYLDRQDEYSMVFFLDDNLAWISSQVIINSWRVVFQEHELN